MSDESGDAARILPELTIANEFYWTSGADGRLRFQQCTACNALIHPPAPTCRTCRSSDSTVTEVSGLGRLIGFTVNQRMRLPGLEPPYVVGHVAIEEDDRVRLTTRIVDADPDDLRLGQQVRVVFEHVEDVYLPLFTPTGEPGRSELPRDEIAPEDMRRHVRAPVSSRRFEQDSAIIGIGTSQIGRRLMRDPLSLTVDACRAAVEDAGLRFEDIDGLSTYPGGSSAGGMGEGGVGALESALRIRPSWYNGGGETFGPGGSVIAAMLAVSAGLARHVLCFRTVWQATHEALLRAGRLPTGSSRVGPPMDNTLPFGASGAIHTLAMVAQRHMHTYGTTRETLGWIALNQRRNAALNPTAIYRDPLTMDDYLSARMITTPFGLYDCDVPCDASIAVVVSAIDTASDRPHPPVRVEAVGTQILERVDWDQSTLAHEPQVLGPAAHLWSRSALRPADVDVALLYDGFSFNCLSWLEGLGFCGIGEARDFLDGGKNIALDGAIPLNPHGGQLSHGRTHGMGLLHEAVVQLRGDAEARQVANCQVAVVATGGLTPSGALLLTR
ncbi:MAG TPA: OB-fold domain-containing protein [Jatrophihabitantaceae bacterium]